jgi:WD40 repeat protein
LGSDDDVHCYSLSFGPDDRLLAAAGSGSVAVFDLATGKPSVAIPGQPNQLLVAFAPDGKTLAVAGLAHPEGNVRIYDTKNWQLRSALDAGPSTVWTLAFSPDSRLLATGGEDETIRFWDVETGGQRVFYRGERAAGKVRRIRTLAFSPDGRILAASCPGGARGFEVIAWDVQSGRVQFRLETGFCDCLAFSPDGKTLAASRGRADVQLWGLETKQLRATLAGHAEIIYHLAFSPDGRTLATGSWDSTVRLWHVATAQPLVTLKGHRGAIYCVAFSPDGKILASSSQYRQAPLDALESDMRLWHAATEEETRVQRLSNNAEDRHNGSRTIIK